MLHIFNSAPQFEIHTVDVFCLACVDLPLWSQNVKLECLDTKEEHDSDIGGFEMLTYIPLQTGLSRAESVPGSTAWLVLFLEAIYGWHFFPWAIMSSIILEKYCKPVTSWGHYMAGTISFSTIWLELFLMDAVS